VTTPGNYNTGAPSAGAAPNALALQAATPVAGYTLVNGTGTIIAWTTPNDGQQHRFIVCASLDVTILEVGGAIQVAYTVPNGGAAAHTIFAAASGTGIYNPAGPFTIVCEANTTVMVEQTSALTAGAAIVWAEIWGS
jgi:hypothetical protein